MAQRRESHARVASITLPHRNPNPNIPPVLASPKPSNKVLYDKKPAGHAQADAPAHKIEENVRPIPQPRSYRPPHSTGDEYLNRFKRNAILVASGVAKNVNRVGNYIKQSVDDILYPYRRRPK
ncbi:uncharacterized protein Pyn_18481 [Prunus yedoensis var. nudiflora]|uniref:Uncharacterized protein n=1 Tax=Prunus yedoensis var. nudiflora TaxID=2094558 RepID=A0A314Y1N6_PRUYE|nr:uncharacterized protein Pyn_18481 [Prunus yedoensis var. nudiflora]